MNTTIQQPAHDKWLAKHQPCGCIICTCDDDERCHGCGAKHCGTHPLGAIPNAVYETRPAPDFGEPWPCDFGVINNVAKLKRAIACVNACRGMADPAKKIKQLRRERDEAHAIVSACMAAMPVGNIQTHTPENLAARIGDLASALAAETSENEAMREAIRFTLANHNIDPEACIDKLQPFIKP